MQMDDVWQSLRDELARWHTAGRQAKLWWRDDDAIEPTEALDHLLAISSQHQVPLTLAVIPAHAGADLAHHLASVELVTVAVHGWSHQNHAAAGRKKQELGIDRPTNEVLQQLQDGFDKLRQLFPKAFSPTMVPPWNRIDASLREGLAVLGYRALSVFGPALNGNDGLQIINTHVDLMDWHGTRGCRPFADLIAELVQELQKRFAGDPEPIGILSHHLVHDAAAWQFLDALCAETANHPAVEWCGLPALLRP